LIPLFVKCPHCHADLMDPKFPLDGYPSILIMAGANGPQVPLHLSCIYGSFRFETTLRAEDGDESSLFCPHCGKSLLTDQVCEVCGGRMALLDFIAEGSIFFCCRRGCKHHKVEVRDLEKAVNELVRKANEKPPR
jgi:hypothetical protein